MADIKDILNKDKNKKLIEQTKLRPWNISPDSEDEKNTSADHLPIDSSYSAHKSATTDKSSPPALDLEKSKIDDSKRSKNIRNNSVTESVTNSVTVTEQLRNNSVIITEQFRNNNNANSNNSVTESVTNSVTIAKQLRNNSVTQKEPAHISTLAGNKLTILLALFELCKQKGSKITGAVSRHYLEEKTGIDGEVIRVTSFRMEKEGFIKIVDSKRGNGGYTVFELHNETYSQILTEQYRNSSVTIKKQFRNNSVTESVTESVTTTPSKLVSNINNNLLTNHDPKPHDLKFEVGEVNLEQVRHLNIFRKHIQDIYNQRLDFTNTSIQDFVDRFAIYASDSKNIGNIKNIPAVFVKMAQLASKGQDPLIDIETDTDRLIRERLERLKALKEERLKQKQELLDLEFENWLEEIDLDQVEKIAPATSMMKQGSVAQKMTLKNYFVENVWMQKTGNLFFNQQEI